MIHLLAKAKTDAKRRKAIRRFIWGRRPDRSPQEVMQPKQSYKVINPNGEIVGEYFSQKALAKHAFKAALARDEIMQLVNTKMTYQGHRIVKSAATRRARFYRRPVTLHASTFKALELIAVDQGVPAATLLRRIITTYVNQKKEELPEDLKQYL